jgi:mRNA interferase HigB
VISRAGLEDLIGQYPQARRELLAWHKVARAAEWQSLMDVRMHFPSADLVGSILIFNILNNQLRLVTVASWRSQRVYIQALMTHQEYDRKGWMRWA